MSLTTPELVYVVLVIAIGAFALVRTLLLIGGWRRIHVRAMQARLRFEAVRTHTPIDDPNSVAMERGIESIHRRFSIFRALLIPLIVALTALLSAPVFLTEASATTASLIGAVVAVVLGLALRPFLENAIAGLVISFSQLVRIGDTVFIDEWFGTIEDINATHTTIKVWDWRRYLVPNNRMLQSAFLNYSLHDTYQWANVEFWVAPDADLKVVREVAVRAPLDSRFFANYEDPEFWVMRMEKDAICCWIAAWADTPSAAWALKNDVRTRIVSELRSRGIGLSLTRHLWSSEDSGRAGAETYRDLSEGKSDTASSGGQD